VRHVAETFCSSKTCGGTFFGFTRCPSSARAGSVNTISISMSTVFMA